MKTRLSTFSAIALVAALGTGAMTSAAFADDHSRDGDQRQHNMGPRDGGHMQARGGFPLLALTCAPNAAERFETMLGRVGERLDLTEEQTVAFEEFRTAALSAQTSFSDTCAAFAEVDGDDGSEPDLIDRLTQRQLVLSAQVEAMDDVLPALEAFYDGLTDEQKAELLPHRGERGERGEHQGPRGFRSAPAAESEAPAAN